MYKNTKSRGTTLKKLIDKVSDEKYNLVGIALDSTYFAGKRVLAHPMLDIRDEGDGVSAFEITLKPDAEDTEDLEFYQVILDRLALGTVSFPDKFGDGYGVPRLPSSPIKHFMNQKTPTSEIQDFPLTLLYTDKNADVSVREYKLNKVGYILYSIKTKDSLTDEQDFEQSLYILIKEEQGSLENFFSALVNEELGKVDTVKVLDNLSGLNITGLFIGGVLYYTDTVQVDAYSIYGGSLEVHDRVFTFNVGGALVHVPETKVKGSTVERVGDGQYNLKIEVGKETVQVLLG